MIIFASLEGPPVSLFELGLENITAVVTTSDGHVVGGTWRSSSNFVQSQSLVSKQEESTAGVGILADVTVGTSQFSLVPSLLLIALAFMVGLLVPHVLRLTLVLLNHGRISRPYSKESQRCGCA